VSQTTLKVTGMSCDHCVKSVEGALANIGVEGKVNLETGVVTVEYDETKASYNKIKEAIEEQGYEVV